MNQNNHIPVSKTPRHLDWITTIIPFVCIVFLCILFFVMPEKSGRVLASVRYFLGDELGSCYLLMGLGIFLCSSPFPAMARSGWGRTKNLSTHPSSGAP